MNIIITLAGHSRRFQACGYTQPKFLINIDGKPMIGHVVQMFDTSNDIFYFIVNSDQMEQFPEIKTVLQNAVRNCKVVVIKPHEKGPVYSALQASISNPHEPVIVSYCDFFVIWDYNLFKKQIKGYSGAIPSFKGFHPASFGNTYYAYTRQNAENELLELREKMSFTAVRHEEYANTGIYYFASWDIFQKYALMLEISKYQNLREGYVSLIFNYMVADSLKILITEVDNFICWGTPEDLAEYYYWSAFFKNNASWSLEEEDLFKQKMHCYWKCFFAKKWSD